VSRSINDIPFSFSIQHCIKFSFLLALTALDQHEDLRYVGTRTRMGSVWVSVALDFLAHRLESGAGRTTDIVSVVTLGDRGTVLIREAPCTWVLYNKIVEIYNKKLVPPQGAGNFLPSLIEAEKLLTRNANALCAAALIFL